MSRTTAPQVSFADWELMQQRSTLDPLLAAISDTCGIYYKDRPKELEALIKNCAQWTKDVEAYAAKRGMSLPKALKLLFHWSRLRHRDQYRGAMGFLKWNERFNDRVDRQRKRFLTAWYSKVYPDTEHRTNSDSAPATESASTTPKSDSVVLVD